MTKHNVVQRQLFVSILETWISTWKYGIFNKTMLLPSYGEKTIKLYINLHSSKYCI